MITWGVFYTLLLSTRFLHFVYFRSWKITGKPRLSHLHHPDWAEIAVDESYWLYLIKCRSNKYYVGITKNLHRRKKEEFSLGPRCPKWLLRHQPLRYLGVLNLKTQSKKNAERLETAFTRRLFKVYGRMNVRGGRYAAPDIFTRRISK